MIDELREKLTLHRNQRSVIEYGSCRLPAINDDILLHTVVAIHLRFF